MKSTLGRKK